MNRVIGILAILTLSVLISVNSFTMYAATFDTYFDWPMGTKVGEELVMGHGVCIMQNFRHRFPKYGDKQHAGVDLRLDEGIDETANAPVYAVADGVV